MTIMIIFFILLLIFLAPIRVEIVKDWEPQVGDFVMVEKKWVKNPEDPYWGDWFNKPLRVVAEGGVRVQRMGDHVEDYIDVVHLRPIRFNAWELLISKRLCIFVMSDD